MMPIHAETVKLVNFSSRSLLNFPTRNHRLIQTKVTRLFTLLKIIYKKGIHSLMDAFMSSGCQARTDDNLINSQVLYQLS